MGSPTCSRNQTLVSCCHPSSSFLCSATDAAPQHMLQGCRAISLALL